MKKFFAVLLLTSLAQASLSEKLLNYTFEDKFDSKKVAETYARHRCGFCHGESGERSSARFSALSNMSASAIKAALIGYKNDRNYGGRYRTTMQIRAINLSDQEINDIVYYLKGHDLKLPDSKEIEPSAKTKNNLFIK